MLPQKIAFVKLRKEFHVEPNEGFAVLLPNESMEFEVSFCPVSAINYEVSLNIMTSFNDKYVVKVVAEGVEPPLLVSSAAIHLRTTGPGEKVIESTMITNNTPHSQSFEVMVPDKRFSWITVSPTAVNLLAGQSCRLEIEYHPPANLQELDPVEWHDGILTELKAAQSSEEVSVPVNSPFEEWIGNCGWMFGSGMFGSVQWPKLGAGKPELATAVHQGETEENLDKANSLNNSVKDELEEAKDAFPETEGNPRGLMEGILSADDGTTYEEVSNDEWGVIGKWNFPILVRPRRRNPSAAVTNNSVNKNISASISMSTSRPNLSPTKTTQDSSAPAPLILSLVTAVILPQIDADVKMLDFGQIAIGTRLLKTFKIVNKGYYPVILTADGFNALGPFNLIRPIKEIQSGESRNVIVECQPTQPGLLVEILRIRCKDERLGGHELRITAKVQGLKPVIELLDLSSPPAVWNPRSGILDFGTCLVNDVVKKKFSIKNKSSFAIDTQLLRVVSKGLPLSDQAAMIARTASGLPVIAICPERVIIQEGATQEIEVVFRPDRGRQLPFSEEIDVLVGSSDEVLRVGIFGRCATKQYFVQPADPRDEPFCKDYNSQLVNVEDLLAKHSSLAVRKASAEARSSLGLSLPEDPPIILEYPNPFAEGVDPQSYIEATDIAAPGKGKAAAVDVPPGSRKQIRKLILGATRVSDNRAGLAAATYEIVLNEEAKASGLWTLSADKGNLSMTDNTMIEITCTLKRPRSLGGLFVGSWQTYEANILIKGGWAPEGDSNEQNIKVVMKAYVSLS